MRISARARYALGAMIHLAQEYESGRYVAVLDISERLGISKIYLEQAFSLLRRGGLVISAKGAQGGYRLAREPGRVTAEEILRTAELPLFEETAVTTQKSPGIDGAIHALVTDTLDRAIYETLSAITLADLALQAQQLEGQSPMFFI